MYAIVDVAGQQFKVEEGKKIFVHRLSQDQGETVELDKVLLIDLDGKVIVGEPIINGALVTAKVVVHMRGDKVRVFKKKRRKRYQKLSGHRQDLTQLEIESIREKGVSKKKPAEKTAAKPAAKVDTKEVTEKKMVEKKPAAKVETKKTTSAEKVTKKKTSAKTTAKAPVKKTATKKPVEAKKEGEKKAVKKAPVKKAAAKTTKKSSDNK